MEKLSKERLETLSNIEGAKPYTDVWELFAVLDDFTLPTHTGAEKVKELQPYTVLRSDEVIPTSTNVKEIILKNTPQLNDDNQVIL